MGLGRKAARAKRPARDRLDPAGRLLSATHPSASRLSPVFVEMVGTKRLVGSQPLFMASRAGKMVPPTRRG